MVVVFSLDYGAVWKWIIPDISEESVASIITRLQVKTVRIHITSSIQNMINKINLHNYTWQILL